MLDLVLAIFLAALALSFAAGLGVVAVIALPVVLLGFVWIGLERLAHKNSHSLFRRGAKNPASPV